MGLFNNPITKFVKDRYTDGGAGINNLDFSNIAKDLGAATALYGVINPNDSSGLANFFGTGGQQQPTGYTGGIPNYTATRELAPNAFASTYTTPDGEVAPRRPGMAGRRYFTDTTFEQPTDELFMGVTAEQIAAQNQAAIDDQALFESILGNVETKRVAGETAEAARVAEAAEQAAAEQAAAQQAAAQQAAAQQAAAATAAQQAAAATAAQQAAAATAAATTDTDTTTLSPAQRLYYDTLVGMSGQGSPDEIYGYVSQLTDVQALMSAANINDVPVKFDEFNRPINFNTVQEYYAGTLSQLDESDGIDADEQKLIADSITGGGFSIDEIATRYDAQPIDVVEGLLRGGFQTPEQITAMYQVNNPDFDEPRLIATLLEEGKTTVDEVVAYYKDHPVYGGLTREQVIEAFQSLGGTRQFAQGGNVNGYYLGGPTDGMADQVPATIDNMQPAALSDGEFVIPADVVSHLGNGNSDAGAQNLYSMMDRVRTDRTGSPNQGRQIDPNKYLA